MRKLVQVFGIIVVLLVGALLGAQILRDPMPSGAGEEHEGKGHGQAAEGEKGPHGGRMLREGDFAIEVTIFERGVPPEFRVYPYSGDRPTAPAGIDLTIELRRLGGRVDTVRFTPLQDYLRGDREVEEPHSFDVTVAAAAQGKTYRWDYPSYEGRVELGADAIRAAKIDVESAEPATIRTTLELNGQIVPNEDRLAHLIPRFPGVVKQVLKRLGDHVEKGELVAVVQSNESLQSYEVRSQIDGTVIKKHVTIGEFVNEGEDIYVVADLSSVWVDLNVYRQDFARLKIGQKVTLDAGEGIARAESTIGYISPFGAPNTQTMLARAELPNPGGAWRPGIFVTGEVVVEETTVPVAVKAEALQTLRDWNVVFVRHGDVFEARPVELGRRDSHRVEVVSGLEAGQQYVAANSFILKAELGKAGAVHGH
jgi:cobalt-zinc-cadmium efflux system membrane fusion protein